MATVDRAFVYTRQKNYQSNENRSQSTVYQHNRDTVGDISAPISVPVRVPIQHADINVKSRLLVRQNLMATAHADITESYGLSFGPFFTLEFSRLNSNIYKNIFAENVIDMTLILARLEDALTSPNQVLQEDHGVSVRDVVFLGDDGLYHKSKADCLETAHVSGIVTQVSSKNVFTVMDVGRIPWEHQPFIDTTTLYLSDTVAGELCHYENLRGTIIVPVGIYISDTIVINIQQGSTGAQLYPYEKQEENNNFDHYTLAEINSIINAVDWGVASEA